MDFNVRPLYIDLLICHISVQKILISEIPNHNATTGNDIAEDNECSLHTPSKKAVFVKNPSRIGENDSPWTVAACSRVKKSAGLGGGVLENFGDLGSGKILETKSSLS